MTDTLYVGSFLIPGNTTGPANISTTSAKPTSSSTEKAASGGKLATGAYAGIGVGVGILVLALIVLAYIFFKRKQQSLNTHSAESSETRPKELDIRPPVFELKNNDQIFATPQLETREQLVELSG